MLLSKEVYVNVCSTNLLHYIEKGYSIETYINNKGKIAVKKNTSILVKVEDLKINAPIKIIYSCDYCGKQVEIKYCDYMRHYPNGIKDDKDCCLKCSPLKSKEKLIDRYGVDNPMYLDFAKENLKNTNLKKYGVSVPINSKDYSERIKKENIKKYGVPYYNMTEECKLRIRNTNMKRYGKEYHTQTDEWKDKLKNIIQERYGVDNVSQIGEIKLKKANTFYKNGTVATSRQQYYLHNILGGELNYSCNTPCLDIAFPNEKIYIEFNGSGHNLNVKLGDLTQEEFDKKELARYYYLRNNGWKCFIINSPRDYLPTEDILISEFNKAKEWFKTDKKEHNHYVMNIGLVMEDEKYGKLRKIKDNDLEPTI